MSERLWDVPGANIADFRRICSDAEWRRHRKFLIENWQFARIQIRYIYH